MKQTTRTKALSWLLSLVLALGLLPVSALPVFADVGAHSYTNSSDALIINAPRSVFPLSDVLLNLTNISTCTSADFSSNRPRTQASSMNACGVASNSTSR